MRHRDAVRVRGVAVVAAALCLSGCAADRDPTCLTARTVVVDRHGVYGALVGLALAVVVAGWRFARVAGTRRILAGAMAALVGVVGAGLGALDGRGLVGTPRCGGDSPVGVAVVAGLIAVVLLGVLILLGELLLRRGGPAWAPVFAAPALAAVGGLIALDADVSFDRSALLGAGLVAALTLSLVAATALLSRRGALVGALGAVPVFAAGVLVAHVPLVDPPRCTEARDKVVTAGLLDGGTIALRVRVCLVGSGGGRRVEALAQVTDETVLGTPLTRAELDLHAGRLTRGCEWPALVASPSDGTQVVCELDAPDVDTAGADVAVDKVNDGQGLIVGRTVTVESGE